MKWAEKVKQIIDVSGEPYSRVEARAGWPKNTLKAAIRNNTTIGIDKAISLATAITESADWLFDESKSWEKRPPAQSISPSVARLADHYTANLIMYAALRYESRVILDQLISGFLGVQHRAEDSPSTVRADLERSLHSFYGVLSVVVQKCKEIDAQYPKTDHRNASSSEPTPAQ